MFTAIICYAGDRVRGELRREINGFQWYCYKNKEAYTIDGRRLFTDLKSVSEISYVAADKDDKEGCFVVKYKDRWKRTGIFTDKGKRIAGGYGKDLCVKRTCLTFVNPNHKEYYTCAFYSGTIIYDLYYKTKTLGWGNFVSWEVHDNNLITKSKERFYNNHNYDYEVFRYDGNWLTSFASHCRSIIHRQGSSIFICEHALDIDAFHDYCGNWKTSIFDTSGNIIAEAVEKVKESGSIVIVQTNNGTGLLTYSGKWIVSPDLGYSVTEVSNGNTQYFKTRKDNHYGLLDSHGKQVIPTEMDDLESAGSGYFKFKHHGFWGVINSQGNVLIDTDRGYTSISDFTSYNKRFAYTMNGYRGECDATGKQISKTKIETASSSTGSSTSSSSSSSSTTNKGNQGNQQKTVVVEHHRDPVPMQQWQACMGCGGMGTMGCDHCGGSGTRYVGDRLRVCSRCNGQGVIPCNVCYGNKGQYITVYR